MIQLKSDMRLKLAMWPFFLLVILLSDGFFLNVSAQSFQEARNLALNGERAKARQMCKALLAQDFDSDVALFLS